MAVVDSYVAALLSDLMTQVCVECSLSLSNNGMKLAIGEGTVELFLRLMRSSSSALRECYSVISEVDCVLVTSRS